MLKNLLESIFFKKTKAVVPETPKFKITENKPVKSDFEVTELSYEEYVKFASSERRHTAHSVVYDRRKPTGAHQANQHSHA
ncbi:MAG: hypothetical protein CVU29_00930 [Betaproteobacteria bacterium HGW-Betaproteobacteria-22]|nr:MAG: hypothetical protein CVU29_00930 [Betaproteobacteria bacterium HGW-Betaproteobacteria-22]